MSLAFLVFIFMCVHKKSGLVELYQKRNYIKMRNVAQYISPLCGSASLLSSPPRMSHHSTGILELDPHKQILFYSCFSNTPIFNVVQFKIKVVFLMCPSKQKVTVVPLTNLNHKTLYCFSDVHYRNLIELSQSKYILQIP